MRPSVPVNAAIGACEKGGQWQEALALFEAMPHVQLQPDLVTLNVLFDHPAICTSELARRLFRESNLPTICIYLQLAGVRSFED